MTQHSSETHTGIIDAHVHAWDAVSVRHAWLDDLPELPRRPSLPSVRERRRAGVVGMVLVEAGADEGAAGAERDGMLRLARGRGSGVVGIVASAQPDADVDVQRRRPRLPPAVCGIRVNVRSTDGELALALIEQALRRADARHGALDVLCSAEGLAAVATAARRGPIRPIVIDHLGDPPTRTAWNDPALIDWRVALEGLSEIPNVVVKVSGRRTDGDHRDIVRWVIDRFGTARCMLGSDWPVSESTSYGTWFDRVADAVGGLDPELCRGTALRTYGISPIAIPQR